MKKILAILSAFALLFALTACTSDENPTAAPDGTSENITDSVEQQSASENIQLATGITTTLFTLQYDKDVWTFFDDYTESEDDYCFITLQVPDPDEPEYYLIDVEIEVETDDPYDFREDLVYYGFDQYEYAVNNAYETVNVGGVELLKYENDDTLLYFNRIENAGATVSIKFDAQDISDVRIADLLKGLTFNIPDTGNEDGPWEWEGTPFSAEPKTVSAGSLQLQSEWISLDSYIATYETFNHAVAATDEAVYLLIDGELSECSLMDGNLAFVQGIELPEDDYDLMDATADGNLWLSGSMNDVLCIKDGKIIATYEDLYDLAMHPSGTWGIDYFTSNECNKVTFNGDTYTTVPMVFSEADTIMHLNVDENNIYVCASAADESGHKVFVYNTDGVLQKTLCDAEGEGLGSITFMAKSENGYIGFDGNMRDVLLWDNDGNFVAEISDGDLFSTDYPWFCGSDLLPNGNIITIMTEERADRSATEVIVFTLSGF